ASRQRGPAFPRQAGVPSALTSAVTGKGIDAKASTMSASFKGRREDRRLLTGSGCFTADWNLPGQVRAAFLRAGWGQAGIRSIDTSAGRALPGVLAVLAGDDVAAAGFKSLPTNAPGPGPAGSTFRPPERAALAHGRVRFVGEPLALAVA